MTNRPHTVVLISGKQGSGKTTLVKNLAIALQNRFKGHRAIEMNFADPLYEMHNFCRGVLRDAGVKIPHADTKDGDLLQMLGTEWGRMKVHPNVWVEVLRGRIERKLDMARNDGLKYFFLIGDCRFQNELLSFPDAVRIRLECSKEIRRDRAVMWRENDLHMSEVSLDDSLHEFDKVFNSGELDQNAILELALHEILNGDRNGRGAEKSQERSPEA